MNQGKESPKAVLWFGFKNIIIQGKKSP